jgi:uncharacterized membrane protein YeaQ/YmgE (transglycosylase-associated protein family)
MVLRFVKPRLTNASNFGLHPSAVKDGADPALKSQSPPRWRRDFMSVEGLIWFLLIGLIAGWLAGKVMRGGGFGVVGDMIVGVIGALLGGWLFSLLGISAGGLIGSIITAFVGAVVLIFVLRLIRRA